MKGLQIASHFMAFIADSFVKMQETFKWPCESLCNICNELENFGYSYIKEMQVYFLVTFQLLWENTIKKAT